MKLSMPTLIAALSLFPGLATAESDIADIQRCMTQNLIQQGAVREVEITTSDGAGSQSTLKFDMFWRPDSDHNARISLRVSEPSELAGTAYLLLENTDAEDELFAYLPALRSVRKMRSGSRSHSLWGTRFNYTDIKLIQGLFIDGEMRILTDRQIGERTAYVLETQLGTLNRDYTRMLSFVDQQACTLLRAEFYREETTPAKVLEADLSMLMQTELADGEEVWLQLAYTMRDLENGSASTATLGQLSLEEKVPAARFDPERFFYSKAALQ